MCQRFFHRYCYRLLEFVKYCPLADSNQMPPGVTCYLHALRDWTGSDLTPSRLAWINQLELDRCNSEQGNHGRLLRIPLHAVIMRGAGNAPDEPTARNWNSIVRIEVRAAVHPPRAGQNQREPIGGVGVWGAPGLLRSPSIWAST